MKLLFYLVLSLVTMQICAQTTIQPFDATINFENAERPCIQVNIDPEPKTLKKAWKDYLKDNHDFKLKGIGFLTNKDLLSAEEVSIEYISSKLMDFYTHIVEDENGSEMKVFARYGYDIYIGKESTPLEYNKLKEILNSFLNDYLPKYHEELIEDTEDRIDELVKEKEDLQDEITDNTEEISELKEEIKEKEEKLENNKLELATTKVKLKNRKDKLERVRNELKQLESK